MVILQYMPATLFTLPHADTNTNNRVTITHLDSLAFKLIWNAFL